MAVHRKVTHPSSSELVLRPQFARAAEQASVPRFRLPDTSMPPQTAADIVRDELILDGNARLNLATFVTTWMDSEARELMSETLDKNMIDKDEYPQTAELELRCVNILAGLWGAEAADGQAIGTSTTGSSEAAMLAGMAMKRRWAARRRKDGKPADRPNIVMGANVQVCWEKFANYWEVEMRLVDVGDGGATHLTAKTAVEHCDENTIGVVAVLGSTYDGSYEPVAEIAAALDDYEQRTGIDVPLHVDGASGGFVAPFLDPDLPWDFRVPRVVSINASGHKYGLVYPGVGWVVWRDAEFLPEELVFHVAYLGGDMPTFALNFSRPGAQVVAQYFVMLRLGKEGFREVQGAARATAKWLSGEIAKLGPFELLSDGGDIPVFAFKVKDPDTATFSVYDISEGLRVRGWQMPAYPMPPGLDDVHVLRVVVKNGFSRDMAALLLEDMQRLVERFEQGAGATPVEQRGGFRH